MCCGFSLLQCLNLCYWKIALCSPLSFLVCLQGNVDVLLTNKYQVLCSVLNVGGNLGFSCFRLYFTKVKMGSPPREFNVQIDTGSDILWVNCNTCSNCPQSSGLGVRILILVINVHACLWYLGE